jgi:hypothetical protein
MSRIDSRHWKISSGHHFQNGHSLSTHISNFDDIGQCWIFAVILKMVTARNFSMSGINLGHHNLPTLLFFSSPFFPRTMNLSTADLRNYWTEFHETWWSYRYMILVGPKVFSFVVKGVKVIFLGLQRGWTTKQSLSLKLKTM